MESEGLLSLYILVSVTGLSCLLPDPLCFQRKEIVKDRMRAAHEITYYVLLARNMFSHWVTLSFMIFLSVLLTWDQLGTGQSLEGSQVFYVLVASIAVGGVASITYHYVTGLVVSTLCSWLVFIHLKQTPASMWNAATTSATVFAIAFAAVLLVAFCYVGVLKVLSVVQYPIAAAVSIGFAPFFVAHGWKDYYNGWTRAADLSSPTIVVVCAFFLLVILQITYGRRDVCGSISRCHMGGSTDLAHEQGATTRRTSRRTRYEKVPESSVTEMPPLPEHRDSTVYQH
jgi:hypothetical protein